jgi:hypothetical protein
MVISHFAKDLGGLPGRAKISHWAGFRLCFPGSPVSYADRGKSIKRILICVNGTGNHSLTNAFSVHQGAAVTFVSPDRIGI